jgi:signal transduction histidine kinase
MRTIIRSGKFDERVPTRGSGDDLDELADLFNRMLERNAGLVAGMREALDNVAHDLRTPLTRLRASAELALRTPDDANALREALGDTMEESERVLTMLRTLMDISEAETGVMRLERQAVRLDTLAREVVETYGLVAEERGIRVITNLLPALVLGDAARLRQLIANLVDNAVKYTPTGGLIELRTRALDSVSEIQVHDTGMGIADEDKPRIFERLYRGDRSRSEPGLGLGLSFVKAICDAHRGIIHVVSTLGKGTEVTVSLPRALEG